MKEQFWLYLSGVIPTCSNRTLPRHRGLSSKNRSNASNFKAMPDNPSAVSQLPITLQFTFLSLVFKNTSFNVFSFFKISDYQVKKSDAESKCSRSYNKRKIYIVSIHCLGLLKRYDSIEDIKRKIKSKK